MKVDDKKPIEVWLFPVFVVFWWFLSITDVSREVKLFIGVALIIWGLVVTYKNRRDFLKLDFKNKAILGLVMVAVIAGAIYDSVDSKNKRDTLAASVLLQNIEQIDSAEVYDHMTDTIVVYDNQEDIRAFVKPFSDPSVSWKPDRSIKEGLELLYTISIESSAEWVVSNDIDLVFELYGSDEEVYRDDEKISFKVDGKHYVLLFKDHVCTLQVIGSGREIEMRSWRKNLPYSIRGSMSLVLRERDIDGWQGQPDDLGFYGDFEYLIYHHEDESKTVVFRRREPDALHHLYSFRSSLKESTFDSIEIGISRVDDVREIDEFLFLVEKGDNKAFSEHLIEGGNALIIEYELIDSEWIISDKRVIKDDSGMAAFIESY